MNVTILLVACLVLWNGALAYAQQPFKLAPAVAVEAENFTVERGWKPIKMGEGNYAVDMIGFSHTSGERFLHAAAKDATASAYLDISVPAAGPYRLWVRYEYMPFTECRFKVVVEQNGRVVAEKVMSTRESLRTTPWSDGTQLVAQYDPSWGNEGLTEEPLDIPALNAGPARLRLQTVEQPWIQGLTANRNIDLLYLTGDVKDKWRRHAPYTDWYSILNAFRDSLGARYEVQFTNRGDKPTSFSTGYVNNRIPWGLEDQSAGTGELAPGASSAWLPMSGQDTSHFSMARFTPNVAQPFTVSVRPVGGTDAEETVESKGDLVGIFLPPYPGKGEKAVTPVKELDKILAALRASPAPGKIPTQPLCYGGKIPYGGSPYGHDYEMKYAQLYAALGMRSSGFPRPRDLDNLKALGLHLTKSIAYIGYRFPPTAANIALAKKAIDDAKMGPYMRWFDYGDEIGFSEWVTFMVDERRAELKNPDLKTEDVVRPMWREWLKKNRPGFKPADYWLASWGKLDAAQLRPDSSADASREKPKLYVDSTIFYEDTAIAYVAKGAKAVKQALGPDVLSGANYSCAYYYPQSTMYIKWFRGGAADFGRHSEYFWQSGNVTPMINGLHSEYFRAGMRFNPKAIIKQYTMPHSPGNTDGDFRRTAFTHLAHGVKNLDFFGIGMNETFTENHIDHRDATRYVAIRDVTHSVALVEDILEQSRVVPSQVALLVSQSTERWDRAGTAGDFITFGPDFRKDRLTYHEDRVGIYTALTFAGSSPDILVEEDVLDPKILNGYKVIFLVGDCIPGNLAPALEKWVKAGGVVFATAGVGRYGAYKEANPALQRFVGIASRKIEERVTMVRPSQELAFLKPITSVVGEGWQFPALATKERIVPTKGTQVIAIFKDDESPAMIVRALGKGKVYYLAALPGMAYLWTGLTTPEIWVADRGPGVHRVVNTYDKDAARIINMPLAAAGVQPRIGNSNYIDTRLISAPDGTFILPLANYREPNNDPVTITIRPPAGARPLASAVSAFCGPLKTKTEKDLWTISLPKLGYGDMVRINVK